MKKLIGMFILVAAVSSLPCTPSTAQNSKKRKGPTGEVTSKLLAADKAVVIDIFKSLDPQHYYLEFIQGQNKEVFGTLSISGDDLAAIKRGSAPTDATHLIYGWYWQMGLLYVIGKTRTGIDLETVLGKENATKLHTILAKYSGGSGN